MQFDEFGNPTPYDLIPTNLVSVKATLVDAFPFSSTRSVIFGAYLRYTKRLHELVGNGFVQWLDGSFVTHTSNPADIDFVTLLDAERYVRFEQTLEALRWTEDSKWLDPYFLPTYPVGHRLRFVYEANRLDWLELFGWSTNKQQKGILQITF